MAVVVDDYRGVEVVLTVGRCADHIVGDEGSTPHIFERTSRMIGYSHADSFTGNSTMGHRSIPVKFLLMINYLRSVSVTLRPMKIFCPQRHAVLCPVFQVCR